MDEELDEGFDEGLDEVLPTVRLYVNSYKWWCPVCNERNVEPSAEEEVECVNCGRCFNVGDMLHGHE